MPIEARYPPVALTRYGEPGTAWGAREARKEPLCPAACRYDEYRVSANEGDQPSIRRKERTASSCAPRRRDRWRGAPTDPNHMNAPAAGESNPLAPWRERVLRRVRSNEERVKHLEAVDE